MSNTHAAGAPGHAPTEAAPRRRSREKTREGLQLAMLRVKDKGLKLSISAVAVEAGVSASLIHNTYPDVAEEIRAQIGRSTRQQRDAKAVELTAVRAQLKTVRGELNGAMTDIAKLTSINETLRQEIAMLRGAASANVVVLPARCV